MAPQPSGCQVLVDLRPPLLRDLVRHLLVATNDSVRCPLTCPAPDILVVSEHGSDLLAPVVVVLAESRGPIRLQPRERAPHVVHDVQSLLDVVTQVCEAAPRGTE